MIEVRDFRLTRWFWMDTAIMRDYSPRLGVYGIAVYAMLASYANNTSGQCHPSLRTLHERLQISRTTLTKTLKRLQDIGLITITKRQHDMSDYESNVYTLLPVPLAEKEGASTPNEAPDTRVVHHGDHGWSTTETTGGPPDGPELVLSELSLTELEESSLCHLGKNPPDDPSLSLGENRGNGEKKKKTEEVTKGEKPALSPHELIDLWNDQAPDDLGAVQVISPKRLEKAARYLKKFPQRVFWEQVIQQIHNSDFLCGEAKNGHRSFKASFDWLLSVGKDGTENCIKVWEGHYRD